MVVISKIPFTHRLIQAVKPIRGRWHQSQNLLWHVRWHEVIDWVADEDVRQLDTIPKELPHFLLGASRNTYKIAPDLYVRAVDDSHLRTGLADQWNKTWHLRVVDDYDVRTVFSQWPSTR